MPKLAQQRRQTIRRGDRIRRVINDRFRRAARDGVPADVGGGGGGEAFGDVEEERGAGGGDPGDCLRGEGEEGVEGGGAGAFCWGGGGVSGWLVGW